MMNALQSVPFSPLPIGGTSPIVQQLQGKLLDYFSQSLGIAGSHPTRLTTPYLGLDHKRELRQLLKQRAPVQQIGDAVWFGLAEERARQAQRRYGGDAVRISWHPPSRIFEPFAVTIEGESMTCAKRNPRIDDPEVQRILQAVAGDHRVLEILFRHDTIPMDKEVREGLPSNQISLRPEDCLNMCARFRKGRHRYNVVRYSSPLLAATAQQLFFPKARMRVPLYVQGEIAPEELALLELAGHEPIGLGLEPLMADGYRIVDPIDYAGHDFGHWDGQNRDGTHWTYDFSLALYLGAKPHGLENVDMINNQDNLYRFAARLPDDDRTFFTSLFDREFPFLEDPLLISGGILGARISLWSTITRGEERLRPHHVGSALAILADVRRYMAPIHDDDGELAVMMRDIAWLGEWIRGQGADSPQRRIKTDSA